MIDATFVSRDRAGLSMNFPAGSFQPMAALLDQLAEVVEGLTTEQYTTQPVGAVESSVGAHVRHCLDHMVAFLDGLDEGVIDFDRRARGTPVEFFPEAALHQIDELRQRLEESEPCSLERPVRLWLLVDTRLPPISVLSSLGRELAFIISHTIHHQALIGAMVKTLGRRVPDGFGVAPATIVYRNRS